MCSTTAREEASIRFPWAAARVPVKGLPLARRIAAGAAWDELAPARRRINFTARVEVDHRAERHQVFNESWRVMKHRFYEASMHGIDWQRMKQTYEPLLDFVGDQEELHDLISEMIGELNASHTGISAGGQGREEAQRPDALSRLRAAGRRERLLPGRRTSTSTARPTRITSRSTPAITSWPSTVRTSRPATATGNAYTEAVGTRLEFTVNSKPAKEGAWKTKVTPVGSHQYATLQYEKWVADRRAMVDKLSTAPLVICTSGK